MRDVALPPWEIRSVAPDALTVEEASLWRAMVAANPALASPYFRLEFAQAAGRVSPGGAIAVLSRGGVTLGFFPYQRRGGAIMPLGAPMNDYHGVIARPGDAPDLATVAGLMNSARFSVNSWVGAASGGGAMTCLMARLPPEGYAAWYAHRRAQFGKFYKDKERARRSLEADHGPIRVEHGLNSPELLDRLVALKREQYRRTGRHDIFACGWTPRLLHELMQTRGEDGFGGSMAALWAGDRLAALEYSLHAGDRYHFWFPAYEPSMARCSPGILLSLATMELAGAEGYRLFDFGFAGEGYKKYFCDETQIVREAVILRPGLGAVASQAAVGLLNLAGADRGEALRDSVRRRWSAIEACETTHLGRLKGAAVAARAAFGKASAT